MGPGTELWLTVGDTFWHDLGIDAVACTVLAGPEPMFEPSPGAQMLLVRVTPAVTDHGLTTQLVIVDWHPAHVRTVGSGWILHNTGVYSLHPSVPEERRTFGWRDLLGGHKMTVSTDLPQPP